MKVTAIINPSAGGNYASEIYRSVLDQFREFELEHFLTSGPGDATEIADKATKNGSDYILCIGGDGTLNEVVQSLAGASTVLVPISAGTGSDFVKSLSFKDIPTVREAMRESLTKKIDMGVARQGTESRYFVNILEVGFGASVMRRVNAHRKSRGGHSFTASVLALLPFFKPFKVAMKVNGKDVHLDLAEMVVANGRYFGGGMLAAPKAELDDGLLDIHVVSGVGKLQMISKLGKLRNGSYIDDPTVQSYRAERIEITGNAPAEMDGEDYGSSPLEISVARSRLNIIDPGKGN